MPKRSRASVNVSVAWSHIANANMPFSRRIASIPHCANASSSTSLSVRETKLAAMGRQFRPQLLKIVDLAIVDQAIAAILADHGLSPQRRQIDDRQSSVSKRNRAIDDLAFRIGPAVRNRVHHGLEPNGRRRPAVSMEYARDPAH